ncbi:cysteinyl-tRNA synthetase [Melghirimyces profundicolus]|uniref:Cysteine--tRNA ligase n=1 Tax=Melghirimyces profundicolus TaxID=1242148 RepID=A0A2T6BPY3_9BACL|nr:cysteine--tRNA ligase [Melghirimyces profundicolus]PTX58155.1 cysteinyl-tRNA synthetase [Melghirimyces profundicolus]
MTLHVYNTQTKKRESFRPLRDKKVNMYVCGPTVYNYIHIGNARVFVFFDVVRRYLEYKGYEVTYVQNFTDVDDRLIETAQQEGTTVKELAERYIRAYFEDMDALGVKRADVHPKATEHIGEMVEGIRILLEKGYAYERDGDVYYRALKKEDYGKLSHQTLEELKAGARVEVNEKKESPLDFALWKKSKPGEISWDSPWGKGRPGWHIECSAMSKKYLGDTLDIHAGGMDLCFPHHENEIAQSEAWTGKPFARYWLHNGYIKMGNEKMSKSLGNIVRVVELREKYEPRALRYFLLSAHYRNPVSFSFETIHQIERGLERFDTAVTNLHHRMKTAEAGNAEPTVNKRLSELTREFEAAMDDDLNTANAISVLYDAVRFANETVARSVVPRGTLAAILGWLRQFGGEILGLVVDGEEESLEAEIEALIEERQQARAARDFKRADAIRDRLAERGIILEDTPQGVRWRRK